MDNFQLVNLIIEEMKNRMGKDENSYIPYFINSQTLYGFTALHYASYKGNIDIIKKLIENGGDYSVQNNKGLNVLHMAVQGDQPSSLIYFVDKYHMNLNEKDNLGSSPLHWACYLGCEYTFNFIINKYDKLINLNEQDKEGLTPLHLAVVSGIYLN